MIGLTRYERDLLLPRRLGDEALALPSEDELAALVVRHLARPDAPAIVGSSIEHIRYKPGVSSAGVYSIQFEDGTERIVCHKRRTSGKEPVSLHGSRHEDAVERATWPLAPEAIVEGGLGFLGVYPADTRLPGLARALDMGKLARLVDQIHGVAPRVLRERSSTLELLRYKPARRAVLRLEGKFRGPEGERTVRRFCVRVLEPEAARASAWMRRRVLEYASAAPLPALLTARTERGILIEEWLEGTTCGQKDFSAAASAAGILAELHTVVPAECSDAPVRRSTEPGPLAALQALNDHGRAVRVHTRAVVHGDVHPDQILLRGNGPALLDLDELRAGAPEEDLASWVADEVVASSDPRLWSESGLVEEYRDAAGQAVDFDLLRRLAALEVAERAWGAIRRMELDALEHARIRLRLAEEIEAS